MHLLDGLQAAIASALNQAVVDLIRARPFANMRQGIGIDDVNLPPPDIEAGLLTVNLFAHAVEISWGHVEEVCCLAVGYEARACCA